MYVIFIIIIVILAFYYCILSLLMALTPRNIFAAAAGFIKMEMNAYGYFFSCWIVTEHVNGWS